VEGELQRRRAQQAPKGSSGRTFFFKFNITRAVLHSYIALRHATLATTGTADIWGKLAAPHAAACATTGNSENRPVSTGSQFN
jgi:hypothetical protein